MTAIPELTGTALTGWLAAAAGARSASITRTALLEGGAVQQNWALDVVFDYGRGEYGRGDGGRYNGAQAFVLRANFQLRLPASRPKAVEFATLQRVHAAGICVPEPLLLCTDTAVIGRPFFVMRRLAGSAARQPLLAAVARDDSGAALGAALAYQLARIHAVPVAEAVADNAALARIAEYRSWLVEFPDATSGTGLALDWLAANALERPETGLVHRDFRTGNFLVDRGRLTGILDWEFAGPGDPAEDIGWLCARCWRGGADEREAGGLTKRAAFLDAYAGAGGRPVESRTITFWEIMAHVRWSLIARQQARRALAGDAPQHELVEAAGRVAGLDADIAAMIEATSIE